MTEAAVLTTRIDPDIKAKLSKLAASTRRSSSYLAARAVEEYVERHSWRLAALETAKERTAKGEFISQDSMKEWAESLSNEKPNDKPFNDVFLSKM